MAQGMRPGIRASASLFALRTRRLRPSAFRLALPGALSVTAMLAISAAAAQDLAPASTVQATAATEARQTSASAQPRLNPTNRTLALIVEVASGERHLGETAIKIAPDDTLFINTSQFSQAVAPLLRPQEAARLGNIPAQDGFIGLSALNEAGFATRFDMGAMRLQFAPAVEQRPRGTVSIRRNAVPGTRPESPAPFSGYINLRAATDYVSASPAGATGLLPPRADIEAVIRWQDVVLESEFTYDGADSADHSTDRHGLAGLHGFTRRKTRLVHDRPEAAVRLQAGDINPAIASLQRGPDLLGVSVERSLRKLQPGANIRPTGERSFRLSRPSTVKVELNGVVVRQLRLDPGEYDLKDLPLQVGANDVRLRIADDLGEQRTLEFTSYFDAALLGEDIYEWGLAAGVRSDFEDGGLAYNGDDPIATGFYRRGLTPELTGEAHVQAGRDAAMAGASLYTATPFGFFGIEGGASFHRDYGAGAAVELDWDALRDNETASSLRLSADLRSPAFATPGEIDPLEDYWLSLRASYSRRLPFDVYASLSGRYALASDRTDADDSYSLALSFSKSLEHALGLGLSLSYTSDALDFGITDDGLDKTDDDELRASLRLTWRPEPGAHVSARYETGESTASFSAAKTSHRGAAAWAARIETVYDAPAEDVAVDAGVTYAGNRGIVSLDHTASLDVPGTRTALPPLTDQRTTLRIATAIAFAGGHVAVGPPVSGGFAIIAPHASLEDKPVLLGDPQAPQGRSDFLGPALLPNLPAYTFSKMRYDVEDLPLGYDLGSREFTFEPPYKAGYALTVGSVNSVSAFGTLEDASGEPVALVTGTATPETGMAPPVTLFTNQAGRFGAQGLSPGVWRIEMATEPVLRFHLEVPPGTQGLHRAGTLKPVEPAAEGHE